MPEAEAATAGGGAARTWCYYGVQCDAPIETMAEEVRVSVRTMRYVLKACAHGVDDLILADRLNVSQISQLDRAGMLDQARLIGVRVPMGDDGWWIPTAADLVAIAKHKPPRERLRDCYAATAVHLAARGSARVHLANGGDDA